MNQDPFATPARPDDADSWAVQAATRPLAFAQVREDPRLDAEIVQRLGSKATMVMIASGGDTAALLLGAGLRRLHLVDVNPAQLALTRLKLQLVHRASPRERLAILGHAPFEPHERKKTLGTILDELHLPPDVFGPLDWVSEVGPDYAGRYEALFAEFHQRLGSEMKSLQSLLELEDTRAQARRVERGTPLMEAVTAAFDDVMRLANLVRIFGHDATQNPVIPFADHFAGRFVEVVRRWPACVNPFLWQVVVQRFPKNASYDWFCTRHTEPAEPELVFMRASMQDALNELKEESVDLVHLSNILDWLSPEAAAMTLQSSWRVLKRGGMALIRQLNSTLNIAGLPSGFRWDGPAGARLLHKDRSFFYRAIHLGVKP